MTLPGGGTLDHAVLEGVTDGQVLRLKGKGQPGPRGMQSDVRWSRSRCGSTPASAAMAWKQEYQYDPGWD